MDIEVFILRYWDMDIEVLDIGIWCISNAKDRIKVAISSFL
tara:strand:- start:75 stop:197 length:123 start_codon:yes stop_codon:yes gene_type:complete